MTARLTGQGRFTGLDWLLLLSAAVCGGSTFYLIKLSLTDFTPESVSWIRIALGALVLAFLPASRTPLKHRKDWIHVTVLALIWVAIPFYLAPLAQTTIDSALAGMLNSTTPLFTAVFAVLFFRASLSGRLIIGLIVGFVGVVIISLPNLGVQQQLIGILLAIIATAFYGLAFNLTSPLQQRNGSLSVIWRTLVVAAIVSTPTGLIGMTWTAPALSSMVALFILGTLCTGGNFAFLAWLIERVGPTRASVAVYVMPVVAIILGVFVAGERIHVVAVFGIALVLAGAFMASRGLSATRPTVP